MKLKVIASTYIGSGTKTATVTIMAITPSFLRNTQALHQNNIPGQIN